MNNIISRQSLFFFRSLVLQTFIYLFQMVSLFLLSLSIPPQILISFFLFGFSLLLSFFFEIISRVFVFENQYYLSASHTNLSLFVVSEKNSRQKMFFFFLFFYLKKDLLQFVCCCLLYPSDECNWDRRRRGDSNHSWLMTFLFFRGIYVLFVLISNFLFSFLLLCAKLMNIYLFQILK